MNRNNYGNASLVEIAWEVCNQVGGIYTVIRSKVETMIDNWGDDYLLVGPYVDSREFEEITESDDDAFKAVQRLREWGYEVYYGYWLVSGKPKTVLINPTSAFHFLGNIKYELWEKHDIETRHSDQLLEQVIAFGYLTKAFLSELAHIKEDKGTRLLAHIHEWMAGVCVPMLRQDNVPVEVVFTTHATLLGRYLAMNNPYFYDHLHAVDWLKEAIHFNIEAQVRIERAAAHGAHIFSTVSEVTANECVNIIGRKPEVVMPNGMNVNRYEALQEFQTLHKKYKDKIEDFIRGHFFPSYTFDLDKTLYFFTSGRFEYSNKGYDLTMEALARLNHRMKDAGIDMNVVMFFVTKQPYHSVNVQALQSRAIMEELKETCEAIQQQVGERLFFSAAQSNTDKLPELSEFVDEYWRLRYRRTIQSWKVDHLPPVVTHNLVNDGEDPLLNFIRSSDMVNKPEDKVKIVYHPDFINSTNPLFHLDYGQFVRGCHLGIFPSYYEPWGYTPLECVVRGVPSVTSDLAGFGDFVKKNMPEAGDKGLGVIERRGKSFDDSANELADYMFAFVQQNRRERIQQRNMVESLSDEFDWKNLYSYYDKAYSAILQDTPIEQI